MHLYHESVATSITRSANMKLVITLCLVTLSVARETQWISEEDIPDVEYLDTSVDPCDNFYQYTCGNFKKYHPRPEDVKVIDLFKITEDELVGIGYEILSSLKHDKNSQALKKAKSAYKACTNDDLAQYIECPELQLVKEFGGMPLLDSEDSKLSWDEIADLVGKTGIQQMFKFTVQNFDPEHYILMISEDNQLQTPEMVRAKSTKNYDEIFDETLKNGFKKASTRASAESDPLDVLLWNISYHLASKTNSAKLDEDKIKHEIADARAFITQLLNGGIPVADNSSVTWSGTVKQLQNLTDLQFGGEVDIQWISFLNKIFRWANIPINEDTPIWLADLNNVYAVLNLVRKTSPNTVKNSILLRTFLYMSPDSDFTIREAFRQFSEAVGNKYYDRWEYCTRKILDVVDSVSLSFAVARDYEKYHFNINKIRKAVRMINDLRDAVKTRLSMSDWLDTKSLDAAIKKIDNMIISLAYPDFIDHKKTLDGFYENVRICEWDNYGNSIRMRAFKQAYALSEFVNHNSWMTSPFEVNAYAIKQNNKIMAPISMLSKGFFVGKNPVVDYSRLGFTLAHEMTHHFDTSGINHDETGHQSKLLSNMSLQAFKERINCLGKQYSQYYIPEVDQYVDGVATLNENLADNGGIGISFLAYQKLIKEKKIRNLSHNYTLEQMFFIGFGTMWCSAESIEFLNDLVNSNTHAPSRVRILGTLSNFKEFSEAFNCPVGSNMNPQTKCVVW